jgi:hypothetical protein
VVNKEVPDQHLVLFVGIKEEGIGVMLQAMNILHHAQLHGWPTKMLRWCFRDNNRLGNCCRSFNVGERNIIIGLGRGDAQRGHVGREAEKKTVISYTREIFVFLVLIFVDKTRLAFMYEIGIRIIYVCIRQYYF